MVFYRLVSASSAKHRSVIFLRGPRKRVNGGYYDDRPGASRKVYPFYTGFQSKALFGQVEGTCCSQLHVTKVQEQIAKTKLHVHYMFWVHLPQPQCPAPMTGSMLSR